MILTNPRQVHYKNRWKKFQDAVWAGQFFFSGKQIKDYNSGRPNLTPSSFMTQCWLTALQKWLQKLYQKIPTPRLPPKVVRKNVSQVQHDKQSSREQSCAEGAPFKIDLCVQRVPRNAVLEDQGQNSRLGTYAQNAIPNRICHRRLEEDKRAQHVQWRIQKDHPMLREHRVI